MKKITEVTRRELFDIIQNGFDMKIDFDEHPSQFTKPLIGKKHIYMPYCGRFSEIEFLERLYRLEDLPSTDKRYNNARGDIHCHTVSFHDWPSCWFLDDNRFELKDGFDDEPLLRFLCEMLHPVVCEEGKPWKEYLERFNELLRKDGYEIYSSYKISGRSVFKYRECNLTPEPLNETILFTTRYRGLVQTENGENLDLICANVTDTTKKKLVSVLVEFAEPQKVKPDRYSDFNITTDSMYIALDRLNDYFDPPVVELSESGYFGNRYASQLIGLFTPLLFDLIEIQYDELSKSEKMEFREEINRVFQYAHLNFNFTERGLIEQVLEHEVLDASVRQNIGVISEAGLRDLLDTAIALHQRPDIAAHRDATEKIWDALERLKTYYVPLDKKASTRKIVNDMAGGVSEYANLFDAEFNELRRIGNEYRIRHHEMDKVNITDPRHYDYFFNRCLSLIALAIQYLQ